MRARNSRSCERRASRVLVLAILALVCIPAPIPAFSDPGDDDSGSVAFSLEGCIERALEVNPAVSSARHAWMSARATVQRDGSLPDPMFTYGYFVDQVETRVGPQEQRLAFRQTLPWFGKLRLRSEVAEAEANAAYQRYRRTAADAVFEAAEAYVEYAHLRTTVGVLERRVGILEDLEDVVRTRYASGDVPYSDLMRAGIERATVSDRLASAVARRAPASARLEAVLDLRVDELLPWPPDIPVVDVRVPDDASSAVPRMSPELLLLDSRIARSERLRSLARRGYFPDLTVGVDYIVTGEAAMDVTESGKDPLMLSASISLPLWFGKHSAEVSEQTEQLLATRDMRRQKLNELAAKLEAIRFEIEDTARRVELYEREIVPAARQSLASARAAYGSGTVGFETVASAEEALLEFELSLARARADAALAGCRLVQFLASRLAAEPPEGSQR